MIIRWIFATVHLIALGIGLGSIWGRSRALAGVLDRRTLPRVFRLDNAWGIAALLWLSTGLVRVFGGLEKGTGYYLHQPVFGVKMGLFVLVVALEVWPMLVLIQWRMAHGRGAAPDTSLAPRLAVLGYVETALVVLVLAAATAMARGIGV